jgi:hypothetical protein
MTRALASRPHGVRATYQAGCRCAGCTAANTAYGRAWRRDRRAGRVRLGAIVSAQEARRHVRALLAERIRLQAVAAALGLRNRSPRIHRDGITLRRSLALRIVRRRFLRLEKDE